MKPSPFPNTSPAGSEWNVTVRSGVEDDILNGLVPPTNCPRIRVVTSSPSKIVNISLSLRFKLMREREMCGSESFQH